MSNFKLSSGDTDFKNRQQKVFDQLLVLEKNRKNISTSEFNEEHTESTSRRTQKSETRHFRGKESIFKKPQNPAPRNYINKIPDFKKNPHKWTKYSLEDVEDVTDESNTKSAMDFLKELADRKRMEEGDLEEPLDELPSKIVFNKHIHTVSIRGKRIIEPSNESDEKASFNNSKLIMPEYVIGQKLVKEKKVKKDKPEKGKELKLDHLSFEDE